VSHITYRAYATVSNPGAGDQAEDGATGLPAFEVTGQDSRSEF